MRRSARGWAAVVLVVLVGGAAWAERTGPSARPLAVEAGLARSATWICPHGGGPGWTGTIVVAAPGIEPVHGRVIELGTDGSADARSFTVDGGTQLLQEVDAGRRGSATVVDVFGGWGAVGWQVRAGDDEQGLGVEPCAPAAATSWYAAGMPTLETERAYVVVANPFAARASVDVTILSNDAPPVRDPAFTDLAIPPGTSTAIAVSDVVPGKDATGVSVVASNGRVAVGTLSVVREGGVRSVLGTPSLADRWILPVGAGANDSTLTVGVFDDAGVRPTTVLRNETGPQGALLGVRQSGLSAATYPVGTGAAAAVDLTAPVPVVASLEVGGPGMDGAATGGVIAPAQDWVVLPTVQEEPRFPGIVLVNPGDTDIAVELAVLGASTASTRTVTVPAGHAVRAPSRLYADAGGASVTVHAVAPIVALGASTSAGLEGIAQYALAVGVPIPTWGLGGS